MEILSSKPKEEDVAEEIPFSFMSFLKNVIPPKDFVLPSHFKLSKDVSNFNTNNGTTNKVIHKKPNKDTKTQGTPSNFPKESKNVSIPETLVEKLTAQILEKLNSEKVGGKQNDNSFSMNKQEENYQDNNQEIKDTFQSDNLISQNFYTK